MHKLGIVWIVLGVVAGTEVASAGTPPPWCKQVASDRNADSIGQALSDNPSFALPAMVQKICFPRPDDPPEKLAEIEATRAAMMRTMLMTEEDWVADVLGWIAAGKPRIEAGKRGNAAWSTLNAIEQWVILTSSVANRSDLNYLADALPQTEMVRAGYFRACLDTYTEFVEVMFLMCHPDIKELDPVKLALEIRGATTSTPAERLTVRLGISGLFGQLKKFGEKVKSVRASDPVYEKIVELVAAARKEWKDNLASRAQLLALVSAMDDARATKSRKATLGCSEKIWPAFTAMVSAIPPADLDVPAGSKTDAIRDAVTAAILRDPKAYLAANALVACESGDDDIATSLDTTLSRYPGYRGPRTASHTAIMSANLVPDRRGDKVYIPGFSIGLGIGGGGYKNGGTGFARDVIASVKEEGELIRIEFPKKVGHGEECVSEETTQRISRIDEQGNVYYQKRCTRWQNVTFDATKAPVTVAKRYAAKLAPKRFVAINSGVVEGVWENAKAKRPLAVLGVPVK